MDLPKFIAATPAQRWASATEVGEVGAAWCFAHCLPTIIFVAVRPLQIRGFLLHMRVFELMIVIAHASACCLAGTCM